MAKVLGIDPAELAFGHPLKPDPDEKKIIDAYRQANVQGRGFIELSAEAALKKEVPEAPAKPVPARPIPRRRRRK